MSTEVQENKFETQKYQILRKNWDKLNRQNQSFDFCQFNSVQLFHL